MILTKASISINFLFLVYSLSNVPCVVLSGHNMNTPLEPLFSDLAGYGSGFGQEQGWIWGIDSLT